MRSKWKILPYKKMAAYLKENNGKYVENTFCSFCKYYECNDNTLVVENTIERSAVIYFDREKVYEEERNAKKWAKFNPLKKNQELIIHFDDNKKLLVEALFDSLKIKKEYPLTKIDLKYLNKAIKKYGYENAIENLYSNLVVFCGEYVREIQGGNWTVKKSGSYKTDLEPILIDGEDKDYTFAINVRLIKDFHEKGRIDIKDIIDFALLPQIFEVAPNPYGQKL